MYIMKSLELKWKYMWINTSDKKGGVKEWMQQVKGACIFSQFLPKKKTQGGPQICRCTHGRTKVLKYTPKDSFVTMQNSLPKQGFCLNFDPLNKFESKEFEWILTNHPLFPETWHFRPLNAFLALRVLLQKRPLSLVFLCTPVYLSAPQNKTQIYALKVSLNKIFKTML